MKQALESFRNQRKSNEDRRQSHQHHRPRIARHGKGNCTCIGKACETITRQVFALRIQPFIRISACLKSIPIGICVCLGGRALDCVGPSDVCKNNRKHNENSLENQWTPQEKQHKLALRVTQWKAYDNQGKQSDKKRRP